MFSQRRKGNDGNGFALQHDAELVLGAPGLYK